MCEYSRRRVRPTDWRRQLLAMPPGARDAWVDAQLGLGTLPDDGPDLPRDGVAYLPAPVDALLTFVELADLGPTDVIIDVGAGLGRSTWALHRLTGARVIGVEVQAALFQQARRAPGGPTFVHGDAADLRHPEATAYFLYCPFGGATLDRWLDGLPRQREARLGCVDLPLPPRPGLTLHTERLALRLYRLAPLNP